MSAPVKARDETIRRSLQGASASQQRGGRGGLQPARERYLVCTYPIWEGASLLLLPGRYGDSCEIECLFYCSSISPKQAKSCYKYQRSYSSGCGRSIPRHLHVAIYLVCRSRSTSRKRHVALQTQRAWTCDGWQLAVGSRYLAKTASKLSPPAAILPRVKNICRPRTCNG